MSAPHIILACLPSLCQKLLDLVEVWRSYNKNNFACFFSWDTVYDMYLTSTDSNTSRGSVVAQNPQYTWQTSSGVA